MQGKEFVVFLCIKKGITVLLEWFVGGKRGALVWFGFCFFFGFGVLYYAVVHRGPTVDGKLGLKDRNVAGVVLFLS